MKGTETLFFFADTSGAGKEQGLSIADPNTLFGVAHGQKPHSHAGATAEHLNCSSTWPKGNAW